jgi:hypothetical protein
MATAPSSQAASDEKSPSRPPMGVRAAETMTMGSDMAGSSMRLVQLMMSGRDDDAAPFLGRPRA